MKLRNKHTYTADEIIENIEFLKYEDEFLESLDFYLVKATEDVNLNLMQILLSCGANPNINGWNDIESLLHELSHLYGSERLLRGEQILKAAKLLLEHGANPNMSGCNNLTPIQVCYSIKATEFESLLIEYGANPKGNKII